MFTLDQTLLSVPGIGEKSFAELERKGIVIIRDLLLFFPLRYEDRSQTTTVSELWTLAPQQPKTLFTVVGQLHTASSTYLRGRTMQRGTFIDESGDQLHVTWFNNPYIVKRLKKGEWYRVSGPAKPMGKKMFMTQPLVEEEQKIAINTNRLVPMYSQLHSLKPTTLRKILNQILEQLEPISDPLPLALLSEKQLLPIHQSLHQMHFPDQSESVVEARRRFALEELLHLIQRSKEIKQQWKSDRQAFQLAPEISVETVLPSDLPFELTTAQIRCITEILADTKESHPMNRLLLGDVGSGKTIVAGSILASLVKHEVHSCLIAPTQVLAEQHANTLSKLFPELPVQVVTGKTKPAKEFLGTEPATLFIGTHAVLNYLQKVSLRKPVGMVVFDEQHRFGVNQRSSLAHLSPHPHILTMTATPIPRSLMLTIFSHLTLSVIDELPANRIPTKTWLLNEDKRIKMYDWIGEQILNGKSSKPVNGQTGQQVNGRSGSRDVRMSLNPTKKQPTTNNPQPSAFQALIICPFIDPSSSEALENVAAVKDTFEQVRSYYAKKNITVGLLHGRMKNTEKDQIISDLFAGEIDILVTTPIVEVGIDLPQASCVVIEAAERFGLASLHQLRGRVGRAGQQGYCMLFTNSKSAETKDRLKYFTETLKGQELAEYDLQRRGAGDIFGTQQHGFDELRFASWSDVELITLAKSVNDQLEEKSKKYLSPLLSSRENKSKSTPVAN